MKKMIFTALAVLVFSAGGFAKTGKVEAVTTKKQELKLDKTDIIDPTVCLSVSIKQIRAYQALGATTADAVSLAEAFYYDCLNR
jgi:hypothetical protein